MKLFTLFCALLVSGSVHAQEMTSEAVATAPVAEETSTAPRVWLQAGPGFSTVQDDSLGDTNHPARTGLMAALELEFPLNPDFSLQAGLDYAQKGVRSSLGDAFAALDYLQIPMLGKAKFNAFTSSELVLSAGPYAAFAVGRKIRSGSISIDQSDSIRDFDIGARFGAAIETKVSSNLVLSGGLNYEAGFLNLNKNSLDGNSKNQSLVLLLGLGVIL